MGVSDPQSVARKIAFGHAIAAQFTGIAELQLTPQEALELTKSYQGICEHYGVSALPKVWELWIGVFTTLGMVYGPRAFVVINRVKAANAKPAVQLDPGSAIKREEQQNSSLAEAVKTVPPNGAVAAFDGGTATPSAHPQGRMVFG